MGQNVWPTKETRENHTSGLVRTELDHSTSGFGCMFRWRDHMELTVKLAGPRIGAIHGHRHGWRRWDERVQMRGLRPSRSCLAVGRLLPPAVALPLSGLPAWRPWPSDSRVLRQLLLQLQVQSVVLRPVLFATYPILSCTQLA